MNIKDDTTAVDLTGATLLEICFFKPDGTIETQTAVVSGAATLGVIIYTTVSGDIDTKGPWKYQGHVILAGGGDFKTDIHTFTVFDNVCT